MKLLIHSYILVYIYIPVRLYIYDTLHMRVYLYMVYARWRYHRRSRTRQLSIICNAFRAAASPAILIFFLFAGQVLYIRGFCGLIKFRFSSLVWNRARKEARFEREKEKWVWAWQNAFRNMTNKVPRNKQDISSIVSL